MRAVQERWRWLLQVAFRSKDRKEHAVVYRDGRKCQCARSLCHDLPAGGAAYECVIALFVVSCHLLVVSAINPDHAVFLISRLSLVAVCFVSLHRLSFLYVFLQIFSPMFCLLVLHFQRESACF